MFEYFHFTFRMNDMDNGPRECLMGRHVMNSKYKVNIFNPIKLGLIVYYVLNGMNSFLCCCCIVLLQYKYQIILSFVKFYSLVNITHWIYLVAVIISCVNGMICNLQFDDSLINFSLRYSLFNKEVFIIVQYRSSKHVR